MRATLSVLLGAVLFLTAAPVFAADYETWLQSPLAVRDRSIEGNWRVNLAIAGGMAPNFRGARSSKGYAMPVIDAEWRRAFFVSTVRGVGLNWVRSGDTFLGPRITYDPGRKASDDPILKDTADIKAGYEAGFFFVHYSGPWRWDGDIRERITAGPKALRSTLGVALGGQISATTSMIIGTKVTIDGARYNRAYYDVSGRGLSSVIAYLTLVHELGGGSYLGFDGQIGRLVGAPTKSQIVNNRLYYLGLSVGKRF